MTNFFVVKNVSFSYGSHDNFKKKVINNLSFEAFQGEVVSIVGATGCGKTTIIKLIAGILKPSKGSISLQSNPVLESRKRGSINYVPQQNTLLPHLTVKENILLPLKINNKSVSSKELDELLKEMSLKKVENLYPSQLSGGISQRVATARALVTKPALLLMDEPFASLDEFSREKINEDLIKWQKKHNITIIFVTHNIPEAVFLSQRILVVSCPHAKILAETKIDTRNKDKAFRTSSKFNNYANAVRKHIFI